MLFGIYSEWEVEGLVAASKPGYKGMPATGKTFPFFKQPNDKGELMPIGETVIEKHSKKSTLEGSNSGESSLVFASRRRSNLKDRRIPEG